MGSTGVQGSTGETGIPGATGDSGSPGATGTRGMTPSHQCTSTLPVNLTLRLTLLTRHLYSALS